MSHHELLVGAIMEDRLREAAAHRRRAAASRPRRRAFSRRPRVVWRPRHA